MCLNIYCYVYHGINKKRRRTAPFLCYQPYLWLSARFVGFAYLGTMAQVGLLRKSLSIEGVLDFHRVYAVFAFATPRFDTAASIARAFAAYPPDHVG